MPRWRPLIIAHRGDRAHAPENTIPALRAARAGGADGCECDVRLSRDRIPVVCHDADLRRFGGGRWTIAGSTAARLAGCEVGAWFHPRFAGTTIPALAEVLAIAPPDWWWVELKAVAGALGGGSVARSRSGSRNADLARRVATVLGNAGLRQARPRILCFADAPLLHLAEALPQARLVRNLLRPPRHAAAWLARHRFLHGVDCDIATLTPAFSAACHAAGLEVATYTVTTRAQLGQARRCAVDAIIADDPGWAQALVDA